MSAGFNFLLIFTEFIAKSMPKASEETGLGPFSNAETVRTLATPKDE